MRQAKQSASIGTASLAAIWPGVIAAAAIGFVIGYWRWSNGLFPGVQGMLAGAVIGWAAGYLAPAGAAKWRFGYRFTATLVLTGVFLIGEVLGIGAAMPRFDPIGWFTGTLSGEHIDLVIGPSRRSGFPYVVRPVESYGWILFNCLDLVFQWFLTLLMFGVRLNARSKK